MPTTITIDMLKSLVKSRPEDGHKGTFGHALLMAGSYGMAGAGVLAGRGCMRSGVGKLTVHIPWRNNDIMQIALPEAILHHDHSGTHWSETLFTEETLSQFNAIGIGPGIGTGEETAQALYLLLCMLNNIGKPMVVDADALNILAKHPEWFGLLPKDTVITPHPLEYHRLMEAGICTKNVTLVLKGHPTILSFVDTDEVSYLCPWGNNGMATAGSGDVLTGIILGLLAQGYNVKDASLLGVSLHALSGDIAAQRLGRHSLIASDLIEHLSLAFNLITETDIIETKI